MECIYYKLKKEKGMKRNIAVSGTGDGDIIGTTQKTIEKSRFFAA